VQYEAMPVVMFGRRRTVDVARVRYLIGDPLNCVVVIESAQKFSAGTNALASTWFGFGRLTAMLELGIFRFHVVESPLTWQKTFWTRPKLPKGQKFDTKEASINAARRIFPGRDFFPTPRCTTPSDGITDALLLAEYGRRLGL